MKYAHPLHVDEVAVDHPDLRIVMAHLGNPWFRDTAEIFCKNPNVWADISGLVLGDVAEHFEAWLKAQVVEIIQFAGDPDKLLYGTDWPIVNMRPYLKLIESLRLEPEDREKLLWERRGPRVEAARRGAGRRVVERAPRAPVRGDDAREGGRRPVRGEREGARAVAQAAASLRPMRRGDVDGILRMEREAFSGMLAERPWTRDQVLAHVEVFPRGGGWPSGTGAWWEAACTFARRGRGPRGRTRGWR